MRAGTWQGPEYYIRCPHCGDSPDHPNKAHYSINVVKGTYHCYRCSASGRLSAKAVYQHTGELPVPSGNRALTTTHDADWEELLDHIRPGPGSVRRTALPRYHITLADGRLIDVFISRDADGDLRGLQLRASWVKEIRTKGDRRFLYKGDSLFDLVQEYRSIRLVEGPYDAVYPEDVALMGGPSRVQLAGLAGFPVILCPDGDVWQEPKKIRQYLRLTQGLWITAIEFCPDGLDPDQVPKEDRLTIPKKQVLNLLRSNNHASESTQRSIPGW